MATIFPTYNLASTPSSSSQASLPPSYAITVHDHVLPPGWQCKYDPKTSKYYFLNDPPQHTTGSQHWDFKKYGHQSCHSSRISSPSHTFTSYGKYFQPFTSRHKVSDSVPHKICQQFPQVDDNYINHLMKIYHSRENLVISALLAEGYTRSFSLPPDETLFYKLKNYFPVVDPELIRHMLIKHDNVEHEVIGAIIATLGPNHIRYQSTALCPGSPKMKLRYLKLMYPEADEAILFDLLYNCDQNAMEAINRLEKMGYKRSDTSGRKPSVKPLDTDFSKTKALRPQTAPISFKTTFFPPNTTEKQKLIKDLEEEFPQVGSTLINMALESSGFNQERARIFLSAMTPQDSSKYLPTDIKSVEMSPLVARYCRGTQTNSLLDTITGTPIKIAKRVAVKVTKGTSTTEDGIFVEEKKKPVAKGSDPTNRKGPNIFSLIKSYFPWKGSDSKNKSGCNPSNRKGPDPNLKSGSKTTAKGPQQSNRKGALGRLIKLNRN
ncbi:unnamed protein product [Medioppia subpectinata]|uniref:CUE domain-containing protein n=1 Tax=Medioppia subpectinata TaxID=1979941 RepID=A0A7R9Q5Z7_9ACAR|nr:unnamed protein product [Medioppia subpectinata]CAG2112743.1 unnamed protein product [Medioppia subpectinata]